MLCLREGLRHGDQGMDAFHLCGMLRMDSARYVLYFSSSTRATRALAGHSRYTCEMVFPPGCTGNTSYDQPLQYIAAKKLEKCFMGQAPP